MKSLRTREGGWIIWPGIFSSLRRLSGLLLLLGWFSAGLSIGASAQGVLVPDKPNLPVSSYMLMDATTGIVIAEHNADSKLPIASLTKMMTAYIVSDLIKLDRLAMSDQVLVSANARNTEGSRMFVRERTRVRIDDLLRGVIVQSGNDASVALAEHIGGTEEGFVDLMQTYAAKLGLASTTFTNSTGLPNGGSSRSTARDIATLARYVINDHPEIYIIYSEREFTYNNITQPNRNRLLWLDSSVDGVKTGHTEEAGYCLAASAKRDDMRLISVIMGAGSEAERNSHSRRLLEHGFRHYETRVVVTEKQILRQGQVWGGVRDQVPLGSLDKPVYVTQPRAYFGTLKIDVILEQDLIAPIRRGDTVGIIRVKNGDEVLEEISLQVLEDIAPVGLFGQIWASVKLFFHRLLKPD